MNVSEFPESVMEDEKLVSEIEKNIHRIAESRSITRRQATYNLRVDSLDVDGIAAKLNDIFHKQTKSFKIQVSFSFVLRNNVDGSYRFYYGSYNNTLLDKPAVVSNREGLERFIQQLRDMDIFESILQQRPNSKWVYNVVTNVIFSLTFLDFPIGSRVALPDYLMNHRSIIALARDRNNNKPCDDNLCFFRALAIHNGCHSKNLEKAAKEYFRRYLTASGIKERCFEGIDLEEVPDMEVLYKVNVTIYCLDEQGQATLISRSHRRFDSTLYLNLFENHFSYITDIKNYCKSFECGRCGMLFPSHYRLKVHCRRCNGNVRYFFPGGGYKNPRSIFKQLEEIGIVVPAEDRFFPFFATFDFECILEKIPAHNLDNSDKLQWVAVHRPISVSCCSNVPEFEEEVCFVNPDQKLFRRFSLTFKQN